MYDIKNVQRKIRQNQRKIDDINDVMLSNKVDGLLDDENNQNYKKVVIKFEEKKRELISENEELSNQIYQTKQTNKWVNWIDDFKGKIKDLNDKLTYEDKKQFLSGVVDKILIKTVDKQTHSLEIIFNSPYVNDKLEWNVKVNQRKGIR